MLNVFSCAIYDILKSNIIWVWNSLKGKKLNKITPGKVEEQEATFSVYVELDEKRKIDFKMAGNLSDEQKNRCIDQMFEFIKTIPPQNDIFYFEIATYDIESCKWSLVNIREEIIKKKQASEISK